MGQPKLTGNEWKAEDNIEEYLQEIIKEFKEKVRKLYPQAQFTANVNVQPRIYITTYALGNVDKYPVYELEDELANENPSVCFDFHCSSYDYE